jgi:hypothetical protein
MKVLVACEFSGIVRDAFVARGHDAWSCDLLPTEKPGNHIQDDVLKHLDEEWDLMIAHPPCTHLTNSGVCWLHKLEGRWKLMEDGADFFKRFLEAPIPRIAVENPIPHKYAINIIGRKADQIIQPWMFGHLETKATCLWLKGLPKLIQTNNTLYREDNTKEKVMKLSDNIRQRTHYLPRTPDRGHERSRTFLGIADAMADQWG